MTDKDEVALSLAALLHDVGKVLQRASDHHRHRRHQHLSAELVRKRVPDGPERENAAELVEGHHDKRVEGLLKWLIEADHASASERDVELRDDEQAGYPLHRPLRSPLASDGERVYYSVASLSIERYRESLRPSESADAGPERYQKVRDELESGMDGLRKLHGGLPNRWLPYLTSLSELLRKTLFFVPSAPYVEAEPTNSLYEHSRLTAALALCFKRSEGRRFTIIVGDVGGIQRFVYGQRVYRQALKSLRGRSAYISFLSDAVAKHILVTLDLPPFNLVFSGGGHFMIVAPLLKSEERERLVKEINRFLIGRHKGALRMYLGFADVDLDRDLRSPSDQKGMWDLIRSKIEEAQADARRRKEQPFLEVFQEFYGELFDATVSSENMVCESCGVGIERESDARRVGEGDDALTVCKICFGLVELAKMIARATYLVEIWVEEGSVTQLDEWQMAIDFTHDGLRVSYYLAASDTELKAFLRLLSSGTRVRLRQVWIKTINSTDFLRLQDVIGDFVQTVPVALGFTLLAQRTPLDEQGNIMTFDELASRSDGSREIGYLKLDLDGMGTLFRERADRFSVLATMSQIVAFVMEGVVERLVRESSEHLYLIYSGGDDLLIVGPWSETVEFAARLEEELRCFFGASKPTATCAVLIEDPRTPVRIATEELDRLMSGAKSRKDCVSLEGEVMGWEVFREVLRVAQSWAEDIQTRRLSRSLVFKVARIFTDYSRDQYWSVARHRLKYVLAKELGEEEGPALQLDSLENQYLSDLTKLFPVMRSITSLVERFTRGEVSL